MTPCLRTRQSILKWAARAIRLCEYDAGSNCDGRPAACLRRRSLSPNSQGDRAAQDILAITHAGPNASIALLHNVPYADAAHTVFLADDHYGR